MKTTATIPAVLGTLLGEYGEMPFNSPLANDINYVLGLGKVSCQ